jgi:hypothetical protein
MRLANESCVVARFAERACKASRCDGFVKVDAVVVYAAGERQHARQDGTSGGHAHDIGRDAMGEPCALTSQQIQMRRPYPSPLESEAVSAVLIAHDQQNVRLFHSVLPKFAGTKYISFQRCIPWL